MCRKDYFFSPVNPVIKGEEVTHLYGYGSTRRYGNVAISSKNWLVKCCCEDRGMVEKTTSPTCGHCHSSLLRSNAGSINILLLDSNSMREAKKKYETLNSGCYNFSNKKTHRLAYGMNCSLIFYLND